MTSVGIDTKDTKARPVRIYAQAMNGAIVTVYRSGNKHLELALTPDECRSLAAVLMTAADFAKGYRL